LAVEVTRAVAHTYASSRNCRPLAEEKKKKKKKEEEEGIVSLYYIVVMPSKNMLLCT
jgi:hypothetical protein